MYDYVVAHRNAILRQMQEVRQRGISQGFDEASYFQDHYDEYFDDPEDEIRFPPEMFDANEDCDHSGTDPIVQTILRV